MPKRKPSPGSRRSKAKRPRASGPPPVPATTVFSSIAALVTFFRDLGRPAEQYNLLVVGPGTRNFAVLPEQGSLIAATVECDCDVRGRPQTQGYLFPGMETANYGENGGMINDWLGNWRVVSELVKTVPGLAGLLEAIYGPGYCLPSERFNSRSLPVDRENWAKVRKDAHVDHPSWENKDGKDLVVQTVTTPPGHVSFVLLCQATTHSIAMGGTSQGIYISPKSKGAESEQYIRDTEAQWAKNYKKATDPRAKAKKVQFWTDAVLALGPTPHYTMIIALRMVFGLPPVVYPSGKWVETTKPYPISHKHFIGEVHPNPDILVHDPDKVIKDMLECFPHALVRSFQRIHDLLGPLSLKWAMNPAEVFDPVHFSRCLFFR